jgi:hypothetical protein
MGALARQKIAEISRPAMHQNHGMSIFGMQIDALDRNIQRDARERRILSDWRAPLEMST